MLDLAIVLALSAQCAPDVSPQTLAAVAHAESRFDPFAIGVNRDAPVRQPRTRAEATRTASRLIASGANIDLGIAQINSDNLGWLGLSIDDAFDPCRNLAAAAAVLRGGFRPISDRLADRQRALRVALSRYNTGHPERGFRNGYVARVEAAANQLGFSQAVAPDAVAAAPPSAPLLLRPEPAPAWDVFARAPASQVFALPTTPQPQTKSTIP